MELLKSAKNVLIYGKGIVGKAFAELLDDYSISNYTFVVSYNKENSNSDLLEDWCRDRKNVVVVVASTKYEAEMLDTLHKLEFENILIPDF